VVSGNPVFVFFDVEGDEPAERPIQTGPGDYIFVPPFVPHREENPDPENLPELSWAAVVPRLP
jgi:uncharacterized RmlC-like cupin family protein